MSNESGPDPVQLLSLARDGNTVALGQLLELYRSYLAILARLQIGRRLQGKVDPADLVQDTFLEAHRHFAEFRGTVEAELVCWLRQILANDDVFPATDDRPGDFLALLDGEAEQGIIGNAGIAPGITRLSRLDFTPKVDAEFTIMVTCPRPGEIGAYTLTVRQYEVLKEKKK